MATSANNLTASAEQQKPAGSNSILQELCSRPKNYAPVAPQKMEVESEPIEMASSVENTSLKMKIKRSNSTNSSNGNSDKNNSKKRKEANSSSSTSSSRSSSPRSSASPISQLPPFLLAAMTAGGNNGPRLDALLRQVANGPPSKKAKLNGDCANGSLESEESSPSSVASPLQGNTSGGNEAATMTEPENLGECEPGTAVRLQGIVWQETEKGLLMLNVTWKGKTYMGTLLDCHIPLEDHKWGPPGEMPADKSRGKRGRSTRSRTPPVKIPFRKNQKAVNNKNNARAKQHTFSLPVSPLAKENGNKNKLVQNHLLQNRNFEQDDNEESDITKDDDSDENNPAEPDAMSPTSRLIECPKPACAKKFRDLDALKYHLSYAHNDLKKAAAIAAERRQKLLEKAIKDKKASKVKKEVKENGKSAAPIPPVPAVPEVKPQMKTEAVTQNTKKEAENSTEAPLDLQKRPVSPAYSDISDEEPPIKPPQISTSLPGASSLPSLNRLTSAVQPRPLLQPPPQTQQHPKHILQQPPPPAHSNSLKKTLSLEESLKRPPQFMPPGFPPGGFHSLLGSAAAAAGSGLPAHLAAAVASGRYPPGFMPVSGFPVSTASRSPYLPPPTPHSSQAQSLASASAKLQELQDRVMASSRPNLHLGSLTSSLVSSSPTSTMTSFSTLARDLLQQPHHQPPSAHYSSLSRMAAAAGSLSAAGLLSGTKHLPSGFPPK